MSSTLLPVLDDAALQRLRDLDPSGQSRLVGRVMRAFGVSVARLGPQLRQARQQSDTVAIRHVAHTLKSSSASIGALKLSGIFADIETAIRLETVGEIGALLDAVDRELPVVLEAVHSMRDMPE
ncbi:MAG: Hpt domain-containing protein [Pseudomonadota bacterium]|nr:Hpt domain-containing protein [Pseudomonadota bacterium]